MNIKEFFKSLKSTDTFTMVHPNRSTVRNQQIHLDLFEAQLSTTPQKAYSQGWWLIEQMPELEKGVQACRENFSQRLSDGKFSNIRKFSIHPEFWCGDVVYDNLYTNDPEVIERLEKAETAGFTSEVSQWLQGSEETIKAMNYATKAYALDLKELSVFKDPAEWDERSDDAHYHDVEMRDRLLGLLPEPAFKTVGENGHYHNSEAYKENHLKARESLNAAVDALPEREEFDFGEDLNTVQFGDSIAYKWYMESELTDVDALETPLQFLTHVGFDINKHKTQNMTALKHILNYAWEMKRKA